MSCAPRGLLDLAPIALPGDYGERSETTRGGLPMRVIESLQARLALAARPALPI